jgi:DNA-binding IclR family transcriptional regulator
MAEQPGARGPDQPSRGNYFVPAVGRALQVIELLARSEKALGVSGIARALDMPKSSCFSVLSTLEASGYVKRHSDQTWSLTLKVVLVGAQAGRNLDVLSFAKPVLERLAHSTGMPAHLALPDQSGIYYADKVEPPGFIRFETYPGKRASLHLTALARAIAAHLEADDLARLMDGHRFEGGTARAAHSRKEFLARLEETRSQGYAYEQEEETPGVCCVAAPVFDDGGRVLAAVGITGLSAQLGPHQVVDSGRPVVAAAAELGELLA